MEDLKIAINEMRLLLERMQADIELIKLRPCQIKSFKQNQSKSRLLPSTMAIEICSKILDEKFTATAVRFLLPASERSGERKSITEASLHQASATESSVMALGKAIQVLSLQNPKQVLIRIACDEWLLHLVKTGTAHFANGDVAERKTQYLIEDLERLRKNIDVQAEPISSEDPEYEELMSLIFEAETEYYQRQEKNNEPGSTRNS